MNDIAAEQEPVAYVPKSQQVRNRINHLVDTFNDLRNDMEKVRTSLSIEMENFEGTLQEAIAIGLVKPAVPVHPGTVRAITEQYQKKSW